MAELKFLCTAAVAVAGMAGYMLGRSSLPEAPKQENKALALVEEKGARKKLFPAFEPYDQGFLAVHESKGLCHKLYYEQSGNPDGPVALYLHGGPGGGTDETCRRLFDPSFYRIIVFDQRGAGQSTPNACLQENTTWHLVQDIEKLRKHLHVEQWHTVLGGSWGSTLALAYAQKHTDRVKSLILRGVFLFDKPSVDWLFEAGGASELFPDAWEKYIEIVPLEQKDSCIEAYYQMLTHQDENVRLEAAKRFVGWELAISTLYTDPVKIKKVLETPKKLLPFARFEATYMKALGWFEPNELIRGLPKLAHLPTAIIHGRRDIVCRPRAAWIVHKALPKSTIVFPEDAGHSQGEPGITDGLVRATEQMKHVK